MKKIIHMSDWHIGYRAFDKRMDVVIDNLIIEKGDRAGQYVIVITGDLVNNARQENCFQTVKRGLDQLDEAGFKHILVVPGNHDYGTGNKGSKKFVEIFQQTFFGREIDFPKKDIIDDVAFLGLDSMSAELNWYDDIFAEGEIGKHQLQVLEQLLHAKDVNKCRKRIIYLHHHPFKWRPFHQLKDSRKLKKILTQAMAGGISIDALLFGHNHQGHAHHGQWGIERCYDAGTATLKPRPSFVKWSPWFTISSSTRVMDLSQDPRQDYILNLL
ncbi:MAG: metallophosphoesterase [Candidatus Omnitrophica bacterium]|nr:metallophosphoesterase [Candidatus Omnitrophota bacterium]